MKIQEAIYSKREGGLAYHVVAWTQPGLEQSDLQHMFRSYASDALETESDDARALGVFTFAATQFPGQGSPLIWAVREQDSHKRDRRCRHFTASRGLGVRYDDFARTPVPYRLLADSIPDFDYSQHILDTDQLEGRKIETSFFDSEMKRFADEYDRDDDVFVRCAIIASSLLVNPTALIQPKPHERDSKALWPSSPLERIDVIDKVVNLLPLGCRTSLGMSTRINQPTKSTIHLTFAGHGVSISHHNKLPWNDLSPEILPDRSYSRQYYDALLLLRERYGTTTLLSKLVQLTDPLDITDPASVVAAISPLAQPLVDIDMVMQGRGNAAAARRLLHTDSPITITEEERGMAVGTLLRHGYNHDDTRLVVEHWHQTYWQFLSESALSRIDRGDRTADLQFLFEVAQSISRLGNLFSDLLTAARNAKPVLNQLVRYPRALDTDQHKHLDELLTQNEYLFSEFLVLLAENSQDGSRTRDVAAWTRTLNWLSNEITLSRTSSAYLAIFNCIVSPWSGNLSHDTVQAVYANSPDHLRYFLSLVIVHTENGYASFERMLPGLVSWVAHDVQSRQLPDWRKWHAFLVDLIKSWQPIGVNERFRARYDLLHSVVVPSSARWLRQPYLRDALNGKSDSLEDYTNEIIDQFKKLKRASNAQASKVAVLVGDIPMHGDDSREAAIWFLAQIEANFLLTQRAQQEIRSISSYSVSHEFYGSVRQEIHPLPITGTHKTGKFRRFVKWVSGDE